ncbi:alpha/beta fold hydrolase [bacterium]|nr:alpha/beta fold hydrolase [bacterium]
MPLPKIQTNTAIIAGAIALSNVLIATDIRHESSSLAAAAAEGAKVSSKKENSAHGDQALYFATLLSEGQFSQAHKIMDPTMQAALPLKQLTMTWQSLLAQLGTLKALRPNSPESEQIGDFKKTIVTAEFERATVDLQIASKDSKIGGFFIRPHQLKSTEPAYANKANFQEIPVKIGSGTNTDTNSDASTNTSANANTYQLDGTLSLPNGPGPYPAVVLVHGSGPCDSDETIGAVKVFRDIAWGLASKEIAVLRYDKRTHQHGKAMVAAGLIDKITVKEETIDDALLAVSLLAKDKRIEKNHIFILGHSLGAMVIPRLAKADDTASGFIIMAGPTRPLEDMLLEQTEYLLSTSDMSASDISASDKDGKRPISAAGQKELTNLREKIKVVKDPNLSLTTASSKLPLGLPASYWLDLRDYKPAEAAKEIKKPILILQGGKDYQITMVDFQNWWNALNDKGNTTFKVYNGLNHGFVKAGEVSTARDYDQPQNVSAEVINDISKWVKSQD